MLKTSEHYRPSRHQQLLIMNSHLYTLRRITNRNNKGANPKENNSLYVQLRDPRTNSPWISHEIPVILYYSSDHVDSEHINHDMPTRGSLTATTMSEPRALPKLQHCVVESKTFEHTPGQTSESERDDHIVIGIVLSNGKVGGDKYQCNKDACSGRRFGRMAEMKRYHASRHGGVGNNRPQFWCPVKGCEFVDHVCLFDKAKGR